MGKSGFIKSIDIRDAGDESKFDELLEERKSKWQTIRVLAHKVFGKVLLIDEDVMGSEKDETYDKAMVALIPPRKNILILGGGDCSLAARLCKRIEVERVTVCEIDPEVVEVCRTWLPEPLNAKVEIVNEDAFPYLDAHKDEFDVLVDDMIPRPHNSGQGYWIDLAHTFRDKWIVGQTGGHAAGLPTKISEALIGVGAAVVQTSVYVPTYLEHWSFTRYRLS